jgi:hypothetical protein
VSKLKFATLLFVNDAFFKDYSAVQLGSKAIAAAVEKVGLPQHAIEEVSQ